MPSPGFAVPRNMVMPSIAGAGTTCRSGGAWPAATIRTSVMPRNRSMSLSVAGDKAAPSPITSHVSPPPDCARPWTTRAAAATPAARRSASAPRPKATACRCAWSGADFSLPIGRLLTARTPPMRSIIQKEGGTMASTGAGNILPRNRPRELEDPLNFFVYHPLAARLARLLVPTGIAPNAVSVMGLVALCAATWAYTRLDAPLNALIGFALMLLWHVVDGADGDLARMTGRTSATGELVDGVCDYVGNIIMYVAFAFLLDDTLGAWAWVLAVTAGASHIVQTNHAETQRRLYLWRAYGVPWLRN